MSSAHSSNRLPITKLILVPAIITLAITLLRLAGELEHWSETFFSRQAGGGLALVGISWMAPIFGIYFAIKLAHSGEGPKSVGMAILWSILGLVPVAAGIFCFARSGFNSPLWAVLAMALIFAGALVPAMGWTSLFKVLLAYAYAARIPVVIIMFFAIQGNWGTHYDVRGPGFPAGLGFWQTYFYIAFLPQMFMWIAYTTITGSLFGSIAAVFAKRPGHSEIAQPA
ncbi:MAG TPA: hypothetical protein VI756_04525 [Blastocatellia bacterium]